MSICQQIDLLAKKISSCKLLTQGKKIKFFYAYSNFKPTASFVIKGKFQVLSNANTGR